MTESVNNVVASGKQTYIQKTNEFRNLTGNILRTSLKFGLPKELNIYFEKICTRSAWYFYGPLCIRSVQT